jgi:hypothetical protein
LTPVEPDTWLWILAGFLAAIFVGTGLLMLTTPRDRLVAVGLVVPPLLDIAPVLSPVAASCLALGMTGATAVHIRRREFLPDALRSLAVVVMGVVLAAYRFGPQSF